MINFVDTTYELSYQEREGKPDIIFGNQLALPNKPIDFQYESDELVSSFKAVKIDLLGKIIETITLSTSLIQLNGNYHICSGNSSYTIDLECGYYYFLVNNKYQSETFQVIALSESLPGSEIFISGLYFYDITKDNPEETKEGKPFITFGREYGTNVSPLQFEYQSTETVNSFKLVEIDIFGKLIKETSLNASLINSNGVTHLCSGETNFTDFANEGIYYFVVNDKYYSKLFHIFELVCPVISDISISNAIEDETAILSFNTYIVGVNSAITVQFTIDFYEGINTIIQNIVLNPNITNNIITFAIPMGVSGFNSITITNNKCSNRYKYDFNIEPVFNCIELYEGSVFEQYESDECLEFYEQW